MFSYWLLHVFFSNLGPHPSLQAGQNHVIPLVCMAIWLLYIHRERDIYILYGSYMSYSDLQCLGCTSKSHNIIMFPHCPFSQLPLSGFPPFLPTFFPVLGGPSRSSTSSSSSGRRWVRLSRSSNASSPMRRRWRHVSPLGPLGSMP